MTNYLSRPEGEDGVEVPRPTGSEGDLGTIIVLINTIFGGLGTLFATTGSVVVTLSAAAVALVVLLVVLLMRARNTKRG